MGDATRIKQNLLPLTGLRFFAALFVFISHLLPHLTKNLNEGIVVELTRLSAAGMTLFFVLSGFVIHYNYSKLLETNLKSGLYQFFCARFARLFPLFFLCLTYDLFRHYRHSLTFSYETLEILLHYFTLTQSWFYKIFHDNSLIYQFGQMPSVAWSISTEWFFYLVYPLIAGLLFVLHSLKKKLLLMIIVCCVAIGSVAWLSLNIDIIEHFAVNHYGPIASYYTHNQDSFFRWIIYFSPYSRVSEFLLGCIICAIYMQLQQQKPVVSSIEQTIGLLITLFILPLLCLNHYIIFNTPSAWGAGWVTDLHRCFGFAPACALLIFCSVRYQNVATVFLSNKFVMWGGEVSYSFYLLHAAVLHFFARKWMHITHNPMLSGFLTFIGVLIVASISYRLFEMPARRILRRYLMPKYSSRIPYAMDQSAILDKK